MDSINIDAAAPSGGAGDVGAPFSDGSDRKATALEGLAVNELSAAVDQTQEDSLSNLLELRDSPFFLEMEDFCGSLFPGDFAWNITDSGGLAGGVASACDSARGGSSSKNVQLRDSPIGLKMENLDGILFADGYAWNANELLGLAGEGVAADDVNSGASLITKPVGAGGGVAADVDVTLENSSVNGLKIGGLPVDEKMEEVRVIMPPGVNSGASLITKPVGAGGGVFADVDLTLENSSVNCLEIGASPLDEKMEEVRVIKPSDVNSGASLITNAIDRVNESDIHDDHTSNESESGISESDDSSSEETGSSSTSSSEEEDELDEDDVCKGDGEESLEMVLGLSDEEEGEVVKGPIRSKNELENLPPVPPVEVSLEPHHQTAPVGLISSIFGNKVIVEGSSNHSPLHEGSILWITDTRSPLGLIDEIFGPVKCPYYVIRFNSDQDIPPGIKEGSSVSFVSEFACHVLENEISKKGYDLSGDNDEELNDELEFSDDEKEAEYRKSLRQAKRGKDDKKNRSWETGTHNKKTNMKARGSEKGMNQPISDGPGKSIGNSGAAIASYTHVSTSPIPPAPSQLVLGGDFANRPRQYLNQLIALPNNGLPGMQQPILSGDFAHPPRQYLNQLNALPHNGMPGTQQPFPPPQFGMSIPLLQQQYGVFPFGSPLQRLPNTAVTGFQMNGLLNQQPGVEAFHHQFHNHNPSNVQNMMSYAQQLHPGSNIVSVGNKFSASFMSVGGNSSYGQAYMCAQLGNCNISNVHTPASSQGQMRPHSQFNPGNSSGQSRNPTKYGGGRHTSRGGIQDRS